MRLISGLCCAVALTAFLAPGVRADEYTKQTFLTFSGPVQLPGVTLPAGTYMLKLADPDSGRRVIQIWNREGSKLYTTLMTIPYQRMEPPDEPVVLFSERAAGEAQAIRAWFYPGETFGQEFIYPKDQAMKIAKAAHTHVLAVADESKNDVASMKTAKVGRVDETGNVTEEKSSETQAAKAETSTSTTSTTTTAGGATTSTTKEPSETNQAQASAANRSEPQAVGTSGSAPASASNRSDAPQNSAQAHSDTTNRPTGTAGTTLPRTASGLELMELLSALSLGGALTVRQLRKRFARA